MKQERSDSGWRVQDALTALKVGIDPYIWQQGQELFRRGAVDDFQMSADGAIHVRVLDPRDSRRFFVRVEKDRDGRVRARCECPYRLGGLCRHQVVALEYLKSISEVGEQTVAAPGRPAPEGEAAAAQSAPEGPVLYRLRPPGVTTSEDGSLLRIVLHSLGSHSTPHRLGLQLFTGTGWTELRTADVDRWISRGSAAPHPRDALLASAMIADGVTRRECDSELLGRILAAVAGSEAFVDRSGRPLGVSLWPWRLEARIERAEGSGVAVRFLCAPPPGEPRAPVPLGEISLVPSVVPWMQLEAGDFHPLIAGVTGPVVAELQDEDLSGIRGADLDRLLAEGLPHLEKVCSGAVSAESGLIEEVEGVSGARLRLEGTPARLSGTLELRYGEEWVAAPLTPAPWTVEREGKIHRYPPAGQALSKAQRELESLGFRRSEATWALEGAGALAKVLAPRPRSFVTVELPQKLHALDLVDRAPVLHLAVRPLGGEDWDAGGGRRGPSPEMPEGSAPGTAGGSFGPRPRIAWLEISPSLLDGDRALPLDLERLRSAVSEDPRGLLTLEDGTVLSLAHPQVRALAEIATSAGAPGAPKGPGEGSVCLPLWRLGEFLDEVPGRTIDLDRGLRGLVGELAPGTGSAESGGEAPPALQLEQRLDALLRPYQKDAVRWFGGLARWGLSGILADEMGLGKTLMSLSHFFGRGQEGARGAAAVQGGKPEERPVLVVCPSSLIFNWIDEARRFFPGIRAVGLYGESPASRESLIRQEVDIIVTSYALLRRDRELLESREFRAVLLDEAQHVKNPESQTAQAAFALRAGERWALTGTPVENHLGDLWSVFRFLMPGFLDTAATFRATYAEPIARGEDDVAARLRAKVRPFLLRRTKEDVLPDLPPRIEQVERVPMTDGQRCAYEACLLRARGDLEGADPKEARFRILAALTRLRQICCHPLLVPDFLPQGGGSGDEEIGAGKLELLQELLGECVEEGHRVLLYSQFTGMLDLIEELLLDMGLPRCRLDGSTRDREGEVRRFTTDPSLRVFLISLKAGGLGLNLTQADTVILYDPWWNPAAEAQAAARAHRIGQTVPVHVHKLVTKDTVEEKILELQAAKQELAKSILDTGDDALTALHAEDLRRVLFED